MNWGILVGVLLASFVISLTLVALSIKFAIRFDIRDYPDSARKIQTRPIPKLGGIAVAVAFAFVSCTTLLLVPSSGDAELAFGVLAPATFAGLIGYIDDRRHLNPYLRLALQAMTGLLVWCLGSQASIFSFEWLNAGLVVLFVMVLINGLNLLDNSDGLAASTVLITALGGTVIALIEHQDLVSLLGFALVGVTLGFLRHNWYPARTYLGDSGAYFLATLLAVLIIRVQPESLDPTTWLTIVLLLIMLPLLDTAYVTTTRLIAGIHPFTAGRDHLSHKLQASGLSVPGSVLCLQVLSLLGAAIAVAVLFSWDSM